MLSAATRFPFAGAQIRGQPGGCFLHSVKNNPDGFTGGIHMNIMNALNIPERFNRQTGQQFAGGADSNNGLIFSGIRAACACSGF
jgi:hypothetical protein